MRSFLGTGWCQALARPKKFCLETKAWRNEVTTRDNKCDIKGRGVKFKVSKMEKQGSGDDAVQSTLQSTRKCLKIFKDLVDTSQGLLSGTG